MNTNSKELVFKMELKKIIAGCDIEEIKGNLDIEVEKVEFDSTKASNGTLFICIKGYSVDGHSFIEDAYKQGVRAFLIQDDVEIIEGCTFIKVKDTRKEMATVASNINENPTQKLKVLGVTGTNGKTSISTFLKELLTLNKSKVGIIGTISIDNGKEVIESKNTTPESADLQKHFKTMVDNNCDYCAMEVSSHSLILNRVDATEFKIGVFTNLTPDHLDFHKDLEDYRKAKELLFYKTTEANVINIDDEGGKLIATTIADLKTPLYTYGIENNADFMAKNISINASGTSYRLVTPTYEADIFVPVPGKFTVYNTLAVIATCYLLGISIDIIKEGLAKTKGVPGRFETIQNDKNIHVIVDYAHTPDALENVINTARGFATNRVITVFGCGGDRDSTKRPLMGKIAEELSDIAILTSDNPRTENPNKIIDDVLKGMESDKYEVIIDRRESIKRAIEIAQKDDIILITGKGHENYQIIGREKTHFDDREVALEFLNLC